MKTISTILALGLLGAAGCTADANEPASDDTSDLRKGGTGDDDNGGGSGSGSGGTLSVRCYQDADHDGYGGATTQVFTGRTTCPSGWYATWTDCNDADATIFPRTCPADFDGDGFSGPYFNSVCVQACGALPAGDCNDYDRTIFPRSCGVDRDGDGYSASATLCVASCGVQHGAEDCDDGSASTHPNRHEIAANAVDDNCNGMRDEAEPLFDHGSGAYESPTSLQLHLLINDATAINAATSGSLSARVTYSPLNASQSTTLSPWLPVVLDGTSPVAGHVVVDGLAPSTIYSGGVELSQGPGMDFRAMTLASSADRITQIRPILVNNAFALMDDRANGTGAVVGGSDFYAQITSPWFESMNVSWLSTWPTCQSIADAFQNHGGAYLTGNLPADLTGSARPGDALVGSDPLAAICESVQTFLAYDASLNRVWTIQDGTFIQAHDINTPWNGIGVLEAGMLK